jgi:hypothetical protein
MSRRPRVTEPKRYVCAKVEVPRAALMDAASCSWPDLLAMAEAAGWRIESNADEYWGAVEHAIFREGDDRLRGFPVLHLQKW